MATQSSQSFIRALKAPSDPPLPEGPCKIEIAQDAWDNKSFYVPNKDEVIGDWLLTKLLKDKGKDALSNAIFDQRYWLLLADVIGPLEVTHKTKKLRPTKTWLSVLLNRIPIAPIVLAFLSGLETAYPLTLLKVICRCLVVIWPLGIQKASSDILLECFASVLKVTQDVGLVAIGENKELSTIGEIIVASFRVVFGNASNKKKIYQMFTQTYLLDWLKCTHTLLDTPKSLPSLISNIHTAGIEVVFDLEIIRHNLTSSTSLPANLESLCRANESIVVPSLPILFKSFIFSVRKNRGALFGQTSGGTTGPGSTGVADEVRRVTTAFFISSMGLIDHTEYDFDGLAEDTFWQARVKLLEIVDQEAIFSRAGAQTDAEAEIVLTRNGENATKALTKKFQDVKMNRIKLALIALSNLMRIDYDLIAPSVPDILAKLFLISEVPEASTILDLLLDHHTKTRTMLGFISILLASLPGAYRSTVITPPPSHDLYATCFLSPPLSFSHLDRFENCVKDFITPGQVSNTVTTVFDALRGTWDAFWEAQKKVMADDGLGSRKKHKMASDVASIQSNDRDILAVRFSLAARMSSVILPSLPLQTLPESIRQEVRNTLDDGYSNMVQSGSQLIFEVLEANLANRSDDTWACQIAAAALLRLMYNLESKRELHFKTEIGEDFHAMILRLAQHDGSLPELSLEIFRRLLAAGNVDSRNILESLLYYMERHSPVSWCGRTSRLTFGESGQADAALALLHLLIDRWLPVVDLTASQQHLQRLARLMISTRIYDSLPVHSHQRLSPHSVLINALRSAQFWELANIRGALFTVLVEETSSLDKLDPLIYFSTQPLPQIPSADTNRLRRCIFTYELLLLVPNEYLPRALRQDLVRRAMAADAILSQMKDDNTEVQNFRIPSLTVVRTTLKRWGSHQVSLDHDANTTGYVRHLVHSLRGVPQPTAELLIVTMELLRLHISSLLRSHEKNSIQEFAAVVSLFCLATTPQPSAVDDNNWDVLLLCIMQCVDIAIRDFSVSTLSTEIVSSMKQLHDSMYTAIQFKMTILVSEDTPVEDLLSTNETLRAWCSVVAFGRWLQLEGSGLSFGKNLISKIIPATTSPLYNNLKMERACADALAILLEEFHQCPDIDRLSYLGVVVATYVALSRTPWHNGRDEFDRHISKTCKHISALDFSHVLELCVESLSENNNSSADLISIVHLSTTLLHDAPPGTLKTIQGFVTRCLDLFADQFVFFSGPLSLRIHVLDFVSRHCSDRPAALRSLDLNSIWSLVSKSLGDSDEHDSTTTVAIFHSIISIVSALIRLRRDLVVHTLPHLGMVLNQLMMTIRHLRPQLGAKQSKLVTDTFPRWINASQPLGAEEGKALARLLTTLTSKSIPRSYHTTSTDNPKAESLAKPFSKHAAYVLKAYIDAMNDPLCVLHLSLRNELRPGLFSLCDMLNEHSRDAMMVSALDAGGKATMKNVWKEYEKQRYVGRG